ADNKKTANPIPGTAGLFFGAPLLGLPSGSVRETWDGSLRGRLGYLVAPTILVYGTGGVAWQRLELSASCSVVPGNPFCAGNPHN
ncbi:outer membrane protein, partial [Klebsiella pneumoniae]|uniref:outer membrane protein n=1 Tax=Klebsiella pneumoniae TaxID=573 RepID=UPI003D070C2A